MPTPHTPSAAVRRALRKLGADIHDARRRRRLPMAVVAERAFTSRSTLQRIEAGDASVGIGIYASVLQALGLLEGLSEIADIGNDSVGQSLASAALPKRSHLKRFDGVRKQWLISKSISTCRVIQGHRVGQKQPRSWCRDHSL